VTDKQYTWKDKCIQHKVVCDLNPEGPFTSTPQHVSLTLHKDGEWYCSFIGFLDAEQLEELRRTFTVTEDPLDSPMQEINRILRTCKTAEQVDTMLGMLCQR